MNFYYILIILACFCVGLILFRGLWNMLQGGSGNKSQKLMQMRVIAQAITIIIVVAVAYLAR